MVLWLRLCTPDEGGRGLIPGQRARAHTATKSLRAATEDPVCCSQDPGQPNKYINIYIYKILGLT